MTQVRITLPERRSQRIHVMAAAVLDAEQRVLIAQRPVSAHQGGLWEFPGGKLEAGEAREQGLARELEEELGIRVLAAQPLICIAHNYADRQVLLDVWIVTRWQGEVRPCEGQPLTWVAIDALQTFEFPAADVPVLTALRLPQRYLITPPPGPDHGLWLADLRASLTADIRLLQMRAPNLDPRGFQTLARAAVATVRKHSPQACILMNTDPELAHECGADGVHLNHHRLWAQSLSRQAPAGLLLGVSCHQGSDLHRAQAIGADFAVLSPVCATKEHRLL